jgi:hypothetical protein
MPDEFDDVFDAEAWHHGRPTHPDRPVLRTRPPVARLMSRLYAAANAPLRARMLAGLLRPLSPLSVVAVAAGAFAGFRHRGDSEGVRAALDDVGRYGNEQIIELVRFVEQVSPDTLQQVASIVADNPVGIAAFSVSVAMLLLRSLRGTARRDVSSGR